MTTKKAKKSPAPKAGRMKARNYPKCCCRVLGTPYDKEPCPNAGRYKVEGKWYCPSHFNPFPGTSSGSTIRGAKIDASPDRRVEQVKERCKALLATKFSKGTESFKKWEMADDFAREILEVCNSKGPR